MARPLMLFSVWRCPVLDHSSPQFPIGNVFIIDPECMCLLVLPYFFLTLLNEKIGICLSLGSAVQLNLKKLNKMGQICFHSAEFITLRT